MAEWLGHSNQKLYQARLLLESYDLALEQDSGALVGALQESVLFQLVLAYQSYLHEIAEIAQFREDFYSLSQLLESAPVMTGEMTELQQLEADDFSWLSQLQAAFHQCSQKNAVVVSKPQVNPVMIQMQDATNTGLPLGDWYLQLSEIIDLQRNNRQES
jgi:hypothetical protein